MKTAITFLVLSALSFCPSLASAQTLSDESLAKIRFDQNLNSEVPLGLLFRDEQGKEVRLSQYFGAKPVLLVLGYYECPMLCTLVLNGMVQSASELKWSIGKDFDVLCEHQSE
jgi:protein SCO1/2